MATITEFFGKSVATAVARIDHSALVEAVTLAARNKSVTAGVCCVFFATSMIQPMVAEMDEALRMERETQDSTAAAHWHDDAVRVYANLDAVRDLAAALKSWGNSATSP